MKNSICLFLVFFLCFCNKEFLEIEEESPIKHGYCYFKFPSDDSETVFYAPVTQEISGTDTSYIFYELSNLFDHATGIVNYNTLQERNFPGVIKFFPSNLEGEYGLGYWKESGDTSEYSARYIKNGNKTTKMDFDPKNEVIYYTEMTENQVTYYQKYPLQ